MEPRIQFAKSADGVAVAYWAMGTGPVLVHMPWLPWSHVQLEWQNPEMNRWYSILSQECTLVRYDVRGTGLSDREHMDLGIDAQIRDLEAVVDSLGVESFSLFGAYHSGPAALTYAARRPRRLAGLALWGTYASGEEYYANPKVASIRALVDDWELLTETGAHAFLGWSTGEAAHQLAAMMRQSVAADVARAFLASMVGADCRALLSQIAVPALVMHPRLLPLIEVDLARRIAAGIPGARFLALEGESLAPTRANTESALAALRDLLGSDGEAPPSPTPAAASGGNAQGLLSPRELEVLRLVASGKSNRDIAEELVLSPRTVERHIANIYGKINVNNRAQVTAYAISNRLA